uniref:Uncharacterized protein n=1 Tax=Caenorhabditis japonica TaxID=281687 RepID=A0A8R1EEB2_CAEJA
MARRAIVQKDTVFKFDTQRAIIDSDGSQFNFDTAIEDKPMGKSMDAMEVDEQESDGDDKKELQAAFAAGLLKDGLKK